MPSTAVSPQMGPKQGLVSGPVMEIEEAATQTFTRGAVIVMSSGFAAGAGANPTNIVGIAANKGLNLTTAGVGQASSAFVGLCMVMPALPHVVFEMNLDNSGALGYVLAQTDIGVQYGITADGTTNIWYVDQSKTGANARVTIVGHKDAIGVAVARVYVVFRESQTIYN